MTGTIKRISRDRGFGFIRSEAGEDYFFHSSELHDGLTFDQLREGQRVEFDGRQGDKGPRAEHVRQI